MGHRGREVERGLRGAWHDVGFVQPVERFGPRARDRERGIVGAVATGARRRRLSPSTAPA